MIWLLGVPGVWYEAQLYGANGVETPQWRVRHLGLGIGLTYFPRPVSAGA